MNLEWIRLSEKKPLSQDYNTAWFHLYTTLEMVKLKNQEQIVGYQRLRRQVRVVIKDKQERYLHADGTVLYYDLWWWIHKATPMVKLYITKHTQVHAHNNNNNKTWENLNRISGFHQCWYPNCDMARWGNS